METKLCSHTDIEHLLQHLHLLEKADLLHFCTIVEPLQVLDRVLKQKPGMDLDWAAFRHGWQTMRTSPQLIVEPLDLDCLNRSLFERSDTYTVMGLWEPAQDRRAQPAQTVSRLILRPSDHIWWDAEYYEEMETWYCGVQSR